MKSYGDSMSKELDLESLLKGLKKYTETMMFEEVRREEAILLDAQEIITITNRRIYSLILYFMGSSQIKSITINDSMPQFYEIHKLLAENKVPLLELSLSSYNRIIDIKIIKEDVKDIIKEALKDNIILGYVDEIRRLFDVNGKRYGYVPNTVRCRFIEGTSKENPVEMIVIRSKADNRIIAVIPLTEVTVEVAPEISEKLKQVVEIAKEGVKVEEQVQQPTVEASTTTGGVEVGMESTSSGSNVGTESSSSEVPVEVERVEKDIKTVTEEKEVEEKPKKIIILDERIKIARRYV